MPGRPRANSDDDEGDWSSVSSDDECLEVLSNSSSEAEDDSGNSKPTYLTCKGDDTQCFSESTRASGSQEPGNDQEGFAVQCVLSTMKYKSLFNLQQMPRLTTRMPSGWLPSSRVSDELVFGMLQETLKLTRQSSLWDLSQATK